jgi:hypothetical protein
MAAVGLIQLRSNVHSTEVHSRYMSALSMGNQHEGLRM